MLIQLLNRIIIINLVPNLILLHRLLIEIIRLFEIPQGADEGEDSHDYGVDALHVELGGGGGVGVRGGEGAAGDGEQLWEEGEGRADEEGGEGGRDGQGGFEVRASEAFAEY